MPAAPDSSLPRWLPPLGLAAGAAAALAVAWGDRAALGDGLPGYLNDDAAQALYLHDSVHHAIVSGRWTLFDPNQFWPFGISYAPMHGANALEMLLSGLFRLFLPWPWWYSVSAYAWIALNALAFVPLGWHLWRRAAPALAGALCWSIMPVVIGQIAAGRLTQAALVGVPIAVLGFLRVAEEGGRRAVWTAGLGVALTAMGYWFNGLFLATVAPIFLAWGARRRGLRPVAADFAKAAGVALVGVTPNLAIVAAAAVDGGAGGSPMDPSWMSPVFPDALQLAGPQEKALQGWFPWVFLAGFAMTAWRGHRRLVWLGAAGVCLLCALGPAQDIGGNRWYLPYYPVWKWAPLYGRMYHPDRWVIVAGVFLVIAAVDGLARWRAWAAALLPMGLGAQLVVSGVVPLGAWNLPGAELWGAVARDTQRGAIVVLPVLNAAMTSAYQPLHGRPMLGGMVENQPWFHPQAWVRYIQESPFLVDLWRVSEGRAASGVVWQADVDRLRGDGFDTVVLDLGAWRRSRKLTGVDGMRAVEAVLGAPVATYGAGAIWRIPQVGREGAPPVLDEPLMQWPPPEPEAGRQRVSGSPGGTAPLPQGPPPEPAR